MASLLQTTTESYLQIAASLLQITAQKYYKLHQFITKYDSSNFPELLIMITNCVSFCYKLRFQNSYKFRQKLLQVAAGVASVP